MRRAGLQLNGPLAGLALLALLVFLGALVLGARGVDRAERREEERLVREDTPRRITEVADHLKPFFLWDEALERLDGRRDLGWAHDNLGPLSASPLFSRVLVVDGADRPLFAAVGGRDYDLKRARVSGATQAAVAEVRRQEAQGLPPVTTPVRAVKIVMIKGQPMVVVASLVRSDTGAHRPRNARAPVLVAESPVDTALRQAFAQRFRLADLSTAVDRGPPPAGLASVTLGRAADGSWIRLRWRPNQPGRELLESSSLALGLAVLVLLSVGAAIVAHGRRMARRLIESQQEARRLALHDPLTGLANRLLMQERMAEARSELARRPGRIAVLCLDLDRFKEVNDTLGHDAGDELICEVARRLKAVCRREDTVARLGGDEFAVLQRTCESVAGVARHAERVVAALSGPVQLAAGPVTLSCSVGVAVVDDAACETADIMRQADLALYRAKEAGRGRFCFFEQEMDQALRARKALETDLRRRLAGDGLDVHYQPLVDGNGAVFGVEALARWRDPQRGWVPPATFIRLAEECGVIGEVGTQVFRRACRDSRSWPALRTSVNLSPVQLRGRGLIPAIQAILAETGAEPARMDLEITEGALLKDDPQTHATLQALRDLGFQLVLDDFGTGYSSLSYLNTYPVSKLKLDRAFVTGLEGSAASRAIAGAIVTMAAALGIGVLAEGVETQGQLDILRALGCREFQGYLFGAPAEADEVQPAEAPAPA